MSTQLARLQLRTGMFQRRGLTEDAAERLATRCMDRDREGDDRRMCIECKNLQQDGACLAARLGHIAGAAAYLTPVKTILQRCERFEWAIPRSAS